MKLTLQHLFENPQIIFDLLAEHMPRISWSAVESEAGMLETISAYRDMIAEDPAIGEVDLNRMPLNLSQLVEHNVAALSDKLPATAAAGAFIARYCFKSIFSYGQWVLFEPWSNSQEKALKEKFRQLQKTHPSLRDMTVHLVSKQPEMSGQLLEMSLSGLIDPLDIN